MAFLGKISAVVAANTSDFSRNIKNAKRDLMNFAASMRGIEFNLNTSALDKTLTKVQQFQAKIRSAQKLLAAGVDAGIPDLGKLQDKFRAVEDLGKPIASLVKQFEGFSTTIQAELLPELEKAQRGFRNFYNDIDSGAATFDAAGRRIDGIRRQIQGLRQAFAAAGDIGNLRKQLNIENVGASFFQPDAKEALQRSLKLRGEAENVPAKFRSGVFAQLAFQAEKNADVIEKQSARVAALQLEIARDGETPRRLERLAAAQERLNDAVARQGQINNSMGDRLRVVSDAESAGALSERFLRASDLRTKRELDQAAIRRADSATMATLGSQGGLTAAKSSGLMLQQQMASDLVPQLRSLQERAATLGDDGISQTVEGLRKNLVEMRSDLERIEKAGTFDEASAGLATYDAKLKGVKDSLRQVDAELKSSEAAAKRFQKFLSISGSGSDRLGTEFERAASDVAVARQFVGNFEKEDGRETALVGIQASINKYEELLKVQQRVADSDLGNSEKAAEFNKVSAEITQAREELVKLISLESKRGGAAGFSEERIAAAMERGFKGRGSFNVSGMASAQLALQQGLFAIDDFMSSTGGLEYKLRAVGNNITQLGLLLGQSGLIPGLSATTGLFIGLAAVMGGQLISSFLRFASGAGDARDKLKALNDILSQQKNSARELASAYESLANSIERAGVSQRGGKALDLRRSFEKGSASSESGRQGSATLNDGTLMSLAADNARLRKAAEEEADPAMRGGIEASIRRNERLAQRRRAELARESFSVFGPAGRSKSRSTLLNVIGDGNRAGSVASLSSELELDARTRRNQNDPAVQRFLRSSARARNDAARLRQQIPVGTTESARSQQLATVNSMIESMELQLSDAIAAGINPGLVEKLKSELLKLQRAAASLQISLEPAFKRAEEKIFRSSTRISDRLAEGQQVIADAFGGNAASSAIAELIDNTQRTIAGLVASQADAKTPEELEAINENIRALESQSNELKEAAMQVRTFASALDRVSQSIDSDVSSLQSRQEEARRKDILLGSPESAAQRERAKQDAEAAEAERRRVQADLDSSRERFEQDAIAGNTAIGQDIARRREIDEQLAKPVGSEGGTPQERAALRRERAAIDARIESAMQADPAIQAAERSRDAATRRAEEARAADRGRQLGMSQLDRDRLAIGAGVNDLRLAMSEELTDEGRQSLAREGQRNLAKQFAPMVMQFANERETAMLKGPSRAALQASDVTTQQGQAELNRLLRGQDSNRDVNLAELQQQTQKLQEIVEAIRNSTGVVVDF